MKHTLSFMVWAILAILLPLQMAQAAAPPTELQKRLQNFPDISDIKPMQSDAYPEKYVFFINQLLDPHHPEAGNFKQRVNISPQIYQTAFTSAVNGACYVSIVLGVLIAAISVFANVKITKSLDSK